MNKATTLRQEADKQREAARLQAEHAKNQARRRRDTRIELAKHEYKYRLLEITKERCRNANRAERAAVREIYA